MRELKEKCKIESGKPYVFLLLISGGFDRGECLNTTYFYDPSSNSWSEMEPMLEKRGRFDLTVSGGRVYAVAGSSGQMETNTAERFDSRDGKWRYIASLPAPISSMGERENGEQYHFYASLCPA